MTVFVASSTGMATGMMTIGARQVQCALGRAGTKPAQDKREGDGASPLGIWPIRRVMWRQDKVPMPNTSFEITAIHQDDGWCDTIGDLNYNQPVQHPYPGSAERMWREDDLYDIVVILGHNDAPVIDDMGSAIFLHIAKPDFSGTQGCIALTYADLVDLLANAQPGDAIEITERPAHID